MLTLMCVTVCTSVHLDLLKQSSAGASPGTPSTPVQRPLGEDYYQLLRRKICHLT